WESITIAELAAYPRAFPRVPIQRPRQLTARRRTFALIEHLAPEDVLCHSDLHPRNVIMTAQGPRLIDWLGAARAPAAYEIAQCHVLISELDPEHDVDPEGAPVNAALQAEYARLAGMAPAALTAAMQPYLPIVRVFLLLGGAMPDVRERLIQRVEAALGSED
ncbi:MAG TPA: phosphotransferase, partial [Polyangiaceae bacterium]|nr:phosphotransferase [Polyangiaceae bacterium]